jgi:uncharacterized membrane protein
VSKIDRSEIKKGLAETQQYLLSHHQRSEWYRCYAPVLFDRQLHICARCSGVYPGIAIGIFTFISNYTIPFQFYWISILPAPALIDWTLTSLVDYRGYNLVRTTTGLLLGYAYGLGTCLLFGDLKLRLLIIGFGYGILASTLIILNEIYKSNS